MLEPSPYMTLWQVADSWSKETKRPAMDIIQIMRVHSTYKMPSPYECPAPKLIIFPTALFSPQGEVDEVSVFNATRMISNEPGEFIQVSSKLHSTFWTPDYIAALKFLNSSECPPEPTAEIRRHLSLFAIRRGDFELWCVELGEPLPDFWFPQLQKNPPTNLRNDPLSYEISSAIEELGDIPSPKTVMKKLQDYAGLPGSCIVKKIPTGVVWINTFGEKKSLDLEALKKRLSRKKTLTKC